MAQAYPLISPREAWASCVRWVIGDPGPVRLPNPYASAEIEDSTPREVRPVYPVYGLGVMFYSEPEDPSPEEERMPQ